MPDQYSGTIRSSAGSTHAYRWRTLSVDRFPSFRKKSMPCDTVANWHRPRIHQLHERSQFSSPRQLPSARSLLLIATSAPLMIINLRFADRHIPVFMPPNYPFHGLTRAMLLRRSAGPSSWIPVTA